MKWNIGDNMTAKTERNIRIVQRRVNGWTYKAIGEHYGISGTRVRQIITKHARLVNFSPIMSPHARVERFKAEWLSIAGTYPPYFTRYTLRTQK